MGLKKESSKEEGKKVMKGINEPFCKRGKICTSNKKQGENDEKVMFPNGKTFNYMQMIDA